MVKRHIKKEILNLNSYEEYTSYIESLPESCRDVYFFFISSKKENGQGWCIYCQLGICVAIQ